MTDARSPSARGGGPSRKARVCGVAVLPVAVGFQLHQLYTQYTLETELYFQRVVLRFSLPSQSSPETASVHATALGVRRTRRVAGRGGARPARPLTGASNLF
eukprot:scaffold18381_cov79-Phaeocystis_antarctica.AAC.8